VISIAQSNASPADLLHTHPIAMGSIS